MGRLGRLRWVVQILQRGGAAAPRGARVEMEVFSFIEGFYNPMRRHSRLGKLSPAAYERLITTQNQVSGQ